MAFWRLILESFVVRFRIAEDVRALRERGGRSSPGDQSCFCMRNKFSKAGP